MDIDRKKRKAIKLAIVCIQDVRRRKYAVNANIYKKFHAESQKLDAKKYDELTEVIEILRGWL